MKTILSLFILLLSHSAYSAENPSVVMDTSKGQITIELFPNEAPETVANFLAYIEKDGYKNTTFHRVIKGFMIQGGGFSAETGAKVSTLPAIKNESRNGLSNKRGTISMARTGNPHSASRQFFINHKDNAFLDAQGNKWGYAVFGKVTMGMDTVDSIANVKTGSADKPRQNVVINSVKVVGN
ncbi:peptidyl-prolyl cis-trans isomerase [Psychromonas marina]|uniref:Peptidyl-prolyl cis-trans isomerase n=1 Tax=Psychromonas marina TaxID=88364 RepID=A0ABQ6DVL7_9GAMM|nr:peptidylprolyl isomerase [Psychromonas marina]GLS89140.1 peptidyl-prolyl cis-trans isomerase [Psychromonas marina]